MAYRLACLAALCVLVFGRTASADFFDDARKTFTNDIPHFFQDDVPCTFGGQPTSGARKACRPDKPAPNPSASRPSASRPPAPSRPISGTEPPVRR